MMAGVSMVTQIRFLWGARSGQTDLTAESILVFGMLSFRTKTYLLQKDTTP